MTTSPSSAGPVSPLTSQYCVVRPARGEVAITGGIWAYRRQVNLADSIPSGYESLVKAGSLENFELAVQGRTGGHKGEFFVDSDVYKWLEAVGWARQGQVAAADVGAGLEQTADNIIDLLRRAQGPDGYLQTWFQLRPSQPRFTDLAAAHELYCAGHLFQAAVAVARGTGDTRLLEVARGFADQLLSEFGPAGNPGVPGHPEVEMALVELSRQTGDRRYLELARHFIDARGHKVLGYGHFGPRYRQDDIPFREARQARGHAVRAAYLVCGALDVYLETGDTSLLEAAVAQWEDMTSCRMYVTGGGGSRPKDEAFGNPFELPPDRAYCETCAAIGVMMWSWRLLLATGEQRYADLMERVLYNGFLVGVSSDGQSYFYANALQVRAGHRDADDGPGRAARSPWYQVACCPPNVMRTLASLQHYFLTTTEDGLQVWQFAPMSISVPVGTDRLEAVVETSYPDEGSIVVRLVSPTATAVEVGLRVPPWADGARGVVRLSTGEELEDQLSPGTLWKVSRQWVAGDELRVDLPLAARLTFPDPRIDAVRGCAAVERGPLVYCVEEVDAGGAERLEALRLPRQTTFRPQMARAGEEQVLGLTARLERRSFPGADGFPYRSSGTDQSAPATQDVLLVPYYSWGNRRPGEAMRVFVPLASEIEVWPAKAPSVPGAQQAN